MGDALLSGKKWLLGYFLSLTPYAGPNFKDEQVQGWLRWHSRVIKNILVWADAGSCIH